MTWDQQILFALLMGVFIFLIWGRWRYDLVAFSALVLAVITGVVPVDQAFSGFGHPATVIIALVLIVSRALANSGAVEYLGRLLAGWSHRLETHITLLSGLAAGLSALMNNVAALALLMPVDLQAAAKHKRSPAATLMPIAFASILGGMITLIGTPPNIVISEFRSEALGSPFRMFDFAPVGGACALVGVAFVAFVGWRLIPAERLQRDVPQEIFALEGFIAELKLTEDSKAIGKSLIDLESVADENEVELIGLVRRGARIDATGLDIPLKKGDLIVLKARPEAIEKFAGALKLDYSQGRTGKRSPSRSALGMTEVVVPENAKIAGRSAYSLQLLYRHRITLLGVSRQGKTFQDRVRRLIIQPGDILLLLGPTEKLPDIVLWLGCLPLADRGLQVLQRSKAGWTVGIFGAAVVAASVGLLYLPIALALAVCLLVILKVVPVKQLYDSIEWPVIVLLGSMIPIGSALESSGGTELIAGSIVQAAAGSSPVVVLVALMVVTMCLSDVMNNTATAVIAAPIAMTIADQLGVNPDAFLMGVAVAASCAFLTPIGHKNNTLIMGPGGYRFGDYWRMGLPLEILIILIATPMILWVWPL